MRVSETRQGTDGGPPARRRRRRPTTVDQAGNVSHGITRQPRATADPSVLDTSEDSTLSVHSRQYDDRIHTLDPEFGLLESMGGFSTATPWHWQMLTVDFSSTGHIVSGPFFAVLL